MSSLLGVLKTNILGLQLPFVTCDRLVRLQLMMILRPNNPCCTPHNRRPPRDSSIHASAPNSARAAEADTSIQKTGPQEFPDDLTNVDLRTLEDDHGHHGPAHIADNRLSETCLRYRSFCDQSTSISQDGGQLHFQTAPGKVFTKMSRNLERSSCLAVKILLLSAR